ncbi:MAG: tRNA uridine(34) 5-carboxymethylaminomethyl modification radical SAM/GNAT enzyme Elp3 [Candidatus Magasanikbacteria bacterium]|nr:tRNA uridine(34) 5-carboxymethylaminomethyl modification radical SAM/GNAT enzyme Elp3 [Candidatus Magasanikbacteria bacterium]
MQIISEKIILEALKQHPDTDADLNVVKRNLARVAIIRAATMPNKTELLKAYHRLLKNNRIKKNKNLEQLLRRRAVRSLSGVAIVTSLVKPYPCPGLCVYCPLDERMPKSYLSEEPAAARALTLKFSPYDQMSKRLEALAANGHPTDKIELIIKGGTWNSYPLSYQYWFVLESFRAANETGKRRGEVTSPLLNEQSPLASLRLALTHAQKKNEKSRHRIIGLTLETRPDCISAKTAWQMREQGCTRLEIGIQHTDDKILALTKRGHDSKRSRAAVKLLKNFGFKVDFHLMPQLPGATPDKDLLMLKKIFTDQGYRPDMIKIYPCTVIKGSELYDWFKAGKYKAYPTEKLLKILKKFKASVIPRYCRISRLIRDIPGQYIEEGNKITNLREQIQRELKAEGKACPCLRCREVGHSDLTKIQDLTPKLFIDEYQSSGGREFFISFEDKTRRVVFAFCRLRLCHPDLSATSSRPSGRSEGSEPQNNKRLDSSASPQNDILYPAFIRELHTYGQLVKIGKQQAGASQHTGLGKKLVLTAEKIVKKNKIKKLAVISGVGVRDYYRHLGYRLEKTYQVKNFR